MMALCIVSGEDGVGKTALCAGLGRLWQRAGKKVGYFKPRTTAQGDDLDAVFLRRVMQLTDPPDVLAPLITAEGPKALQSLSDGLAAVSDDRDVILVEGTSLEDLSLSQVVKLLNAQVMLLVRYRSGLGAEDVARAVAPYQERLAAVVINFVPFQRLAELRRSLIPQLEAHKVTLVGLLPEEPSLLGVALEDVANSLEGSFITATERAKEMVERVTVVPITVDVSPPFFERHPQAALITRGDRPDLQLFALDGPGLCLVLTEAREVNPSVLYRAEERGVPLLATPLNTVASLERLGEAFSRAHFRQEAKLEVLERLLVEHLDVDALSSALGLQDRFNRGIRSAAT